MLAHVIKNSKQDLFLRIKIYPKNEQTLESLKRSLST